jgi:hypothetical protein
MHRRKFGGARGQMPLQYLLYIRIVICLLSGRGANKKYKYFVNDNLGGVKRERKN